MHEARTKFAPEIAVVVAARNVERFIDETITSVQSQSMRNWQLILVIDNSTDQTLKIAQDHAVQDRRITVIKGTFGGVSPARNAGLAAIDAPNVLFLDGDDLLNNDSLARYVSGLNSDGQPVAVVAGHAKIDEDGALIPGEDGNTRPAFPGPFPALLERNIIVNGGAIAIKTKAARDVGGFDAELRMGEDWEFWVRLALLGPIQSIGPEPAMLYRQRRQSAMTLERGSLFSLQTGAIDKIYANPDLQNRFAAEELNPHKRAALIDLHWTATRAALHRREWSRFAVLGLITALRFPDSLVKVYLWRYLARFLGRKLSFAR